MYSARIIFTALQRTTLLMVLAALAACGGSEDEQPCSQTLAVLTAGLCLLGEVTYSSTSTSGSNSIPPPHSSNTVVIRRVAEFEPNSTLDNANPVAFRNATADQHIGIEITGSVSQTDDSSDFFILSAPRSGHFLVYLCDESCGEALHSEQVFLMVYDQSQSTIASTTLGSVVKQQLGVNLLAGLAYYVEVNGYNTGPSPIDYKLVLID